MSRKYGATSLPSNKVFLPSSIPPEASLNSLSLFMSFVSSNRRFDFLFSFLFPPHDLLAMRRQRERRIDLVGRSDRVRKGFPRSVGPRVRGRASCRPIRRAGPPQGRGEAGRGKGRWRRRYQDQDEDLSTLSTTKGTFSCLLIASKEHRQHASQILSQHPPCTLLFPFLFLPLFSPTTPTTAFWAPFTTQFFVLFFLFQITKEMRSTQRIV